ncbi:PQQ-dependent sugar dehydrogenase [Aeromicrobium wangtongii]|uniref:PQQ-dependent sugar dehydrogenase n=1 Tax=Aeromicrobium wangtongii TaxID=2969247 RepID=A0ABY5M8U5_9ACTN|nr:PQQ-dependent sugar dehydrogenase [Aeromicrobium wangtongii]MCD9200109.1 PQQ-dependent sugar dehydrogenase [Aeromicrobium wangtongii]UUP13364.1 PQQ-dependent sugar dehydrogenase [Aeromicrobium wangtongii]
MMRSWRVIPALVLTVPVLVATPAVADRPDLRVSVVQDGLSHPWDLAFLPDGRMLVTERDSRRLSLATPGGPRRTVLTAPRHMWAAGETGLMSVEVAADFARSRGIITCHGYRRGGVQDVRVVRWRLSSAGTSASYVRTLVSGLPSTSGRHGGCALAKGPRNQLYIGTGDAATGRNPQRLTSGGGKVLRVDATTGRPVASNPFIRSSNRMKQRVFTYGHRNVQGLARRSDGTMWSVEQGSYRDDEVNRLAKKANYGWNPVPRKATDPAYNEGAGSPMTDHRLPGAQRGARWRSGSSTVAASAGAFVTGRSWGDWRGALAVSALKDTSLRLLRFSKGGSLRGTWKPAALDGRYGRLRGAVAGPDGALYVTTSNGTNDKILRVTAGG